MTNDEITKFESGYNEGFFYAAQAVASAVLRLIDNHPSWMLNTARRESKARIKMETERILRKRGLIPYSYEVIMGRAEAVEVDFNLDY